MNFIDSANRSMQLGNLQHSSSSSDLSEKNNRQRMKSFKGLSTKRNSVMDHLLHYKDEGIKGSQSATLFKSQRWSFKPRKEEKQTNVQTNSCKQLQDNPFLRAKRNYLNKDKVTPNFSKSGKSIQEDEEDFSQDGKITTFRVLKRGSLNTPIQKTQAQQV